MSLPSKSIGKPRLVLRSRWCTPLPACARALQAHASPVPLRLHMFSPFSYAEQQRGPRQPPPPTGIDRWCMCSRRLVRGRQACAPGRAHAIRRRALLQRWRSPCCCARACQARVHRMRRSRRLGRRAALGAVAGAGRARVRARARSPRRREAAPRGPALTHWRAPAQPPPRLLQRVRREPHVWLFGAIPCKHRK